MLYCDVTIKFTTEAREMNELVPDRLFFFTEDEEIWSGLEIYKTHIIEGTFGEILRHALNSITLIHERER